MENFNVAMFNANGQLLQFISKRKAVVLLYMNEAMPVGITKEKWRSPSTEISIPRGVILNKRASKYFQGENRCTREKVLKRDKHECQYCGALATTWDHIKPRAMGGVDSWENCVAACEPCNIKKGHKSLETCGLKLRSIPKKPEVPDDAEVWNKILNHEEDQ